jgi:LuxR family maltose regulon positive regulatory protein
MVRLLLARQRMNLPAAAEEAQRLRVVADALDRAPLGLSQELRALALINLGITEYWGGRLAEAEPHLEHGITLARRIGRPYLEFLGLAHRTSIASVRSSPYALAEERQADDRTGPAARLDRRACRRHSLHRARGGADLAAGP